MKRLDIVNARLKKLYDVLFDLTNPHDNQEEIKSEIIKYERERALIYSREYYKRLKEMPWLSENDIYKQIMTRNAEFDCLFLELIQKCPRIVDDINILLPIVDFINGGTELLLPNAAVTNSGNNKVIRLREMLTINRNVLADTHLIRRINEECYHQIRDILKSITLMSNAKFRDYLANISILKNRNYTNIHLMEKALKEGLNFDLVLALGSDSHAKEYFDTNMSKELLDEIANTKTKTLKKQILSIIYKCNDDKILNILVRFFEIDVIREQLLDQNSFYYNLLIKPIYDGISHKEYALIVPNSDTQEYYSKNTSIELLDQIALSTSKTVKKQLLSKIFNFADDKILNILADFLEIDIVRKQLLDQNSFYYNLLIKPIYDGISYEEYALIGPNSGTQEYYSKNTSIELLDQIALSTSKTVKKQMLSMIFNCTDDSILNILVQFLKYDDVRKQLLDQNSFYYNLLIKPIHNGLPYENYGSIDELLNQCSDGFDNYILDCDNTDMLAHAFDNISGPYVYYQREGIVHAVPANKFTQSFNASIDKFHQILDFINMLANTYDQNHLSSKYENALNDDLRVIATNALLANEDIKMTKKELKEWKKYIEATYGDTYDEELDDNINILLGYGLDSFEEDTPKNLNYCFYWKMNNTQNTKTMIG